MCLLYFPGEGGVRCVSLCLCAFFWLLKDARFRPSKQFCTGYVSVRDLNSERMAPGMLAAALDPQVGDCDVRMDSQRRPRRLCRAGVPQAVCIGCCQRTSARKTGKRGHYEGVLFTGGLSRISKIPKFSRISREWSDSPLFSRVWSLSLESLEL